MGIVVKDSIHCSEKKIGFEGNRKLPISDRGGNERFNVWKNTKVVYFFQEPFYADPVPSDPCVQVFTYEERVNRGTQSHLMVCHDAKAFASELRGLVGSDDVPVCLVGGLETMPLSKKLVGDLVRELNSNGFVVSCDSEHSDLLLPATRVAAIYPGFVKVRRIPYSRTFSGWEETTLTFPMIDKV